MSEKARKLKEEASRLIAKGRLAEAAEEYKKIVALDPRDLTARQKLAELYARMGKVREAVAEYQSVAGSYAADGLLLKAIAVCKIILQVDPAHKETQTILADLSTRRRGESTAVEMPKAMSAALGGATTASGKRSASEIRGVRAEQLRPKPQGPMPTVVPDGTLQRQAQAAPQPPQQQQPAQPRAPMHQPGAAIPLGMSAGAAQPATLHEVPQPTGRRDSGETLGASLATQLPAPTWPPAQAQVAQPAGPGWPPAQAQPQPQQPPGPSWPPQQPAAPSSSMSAADAAAAALMAAFDAAPGPAAAAAASSDAAVPADDLAIEVSVDSLEGAPVVMGQAALEPPPVMGAPIELTPINTMSASEMFAQASGQPLAQEAVVVGVASMEGAPLPQDLPPDEAVIDDGGGDDAHDATDLIELTEPARVEIDKVPPIPLFSDLPQAAFIALTERMELRVAAKDDILVQEGERGTSMFIIIQGRVVVKRREIDSSGQRGEIALAELTDGAFFGEMALLSDAPRMASVVCGDDTMLFEISRDLLADITREYPSVGEVMKKFHKNRLLTNLLKTSPIFQPFSTKDKKDLIEKFKSRSVEEGVYLITRERPGEGLYVVLSGRCEVLDVNPDGKEVLLAELKEGDVFGEMSMLWHKKTCASVKAATPCVVLRLPRENFNEVIMTHPQILETLTALSERRQKANQEMRAPEVVSDFLV